MRHPLPEWPARSTLLRRIFFENATQKALALALAVTVVVFVREDKTATVTAQVPVRVSWPADRVLVSPTLDRLVVTVEGKYSAIRKFDAEELPPFDIALTGTESEQFAIEPEAVKVPPGLKVRQVRPAAMLVTFEEKRRKTVPVVARTTGQPDGGFRLTQEGTVVPAEVVVEGAASAVDPIVRVETMPIDLTGRNQTITLETPLTPPPTHVVFLGPQRYKVALTIEERQGTRLVTGRPIQVRNMPDGPPTFEVLPSTADVTLHGPVRILDNLDVEALGIFVDARDLEQSRRPAHSKPLAMDPIVGLKLVELKPVRATLVRLPEPAEDSATVGDGGVKPPERKPARRRPAP